MYAASMPDSLTELPFELASQILSSECLDAASLIRLRRVCKSWKKLSDSDEVCHSAAYRWGFVPNLTDTVEDVVRTKMDENCYFAGVETWKDLCIAQDALDAELGNEQRGKELQFPTSYYFHAAQSQTTDGIWQDLWRKKVLPEDGTTVSTGMGGGVRVSDLRTHELLWSIPPNMTTPHPHLEAESGVLVWKGNSELHEEGQIQVQHLTSCSFSTANDSLSTFMVYKAEHMFSDLPYKPMRGHYRPWKVLRHYNATMRAFRFKNGQLAQ